MVAPGGEALGGLIGAFRHMIQTEGFFSLYKGLVPSIVSMAPSGAVFYGVYDILKSAYLHSPEGKKRLQNMRKDQDLSALEQLELGPVRTLLYGAIAGCCSEAATYPFEVVRRQLQMQVCATKLNALATFVKIVEQGGVPALYAGLTPSLLQVWCVFFFIMIFLYFGSPSFSKGRLCYTFGFSCIKILELHGPCPFVDGCFAHFVLWFGQKSTTNIFHIFSIRAHLMFPSFISC